jgi:hypothetical protein
MLIVSLHFFRDKLYFGDFYDDDKFLDWMTDM